MKKLYIRFKSTALDEEHQFKEIHSSIYNCKEYVWNGYLKKNWSFQLVDENGLSLPYISEGYDQNRGVTTDTEISNREFSVRNALNCQDKNFMYHYMNKGSSFCYEGRWRKVYLYVRVYDNEENCRWLAINLQHDVEDDIKRLRIMGLLTEEMEEVLVMMATSQDR